MENYTRFKVNECKDILTRAFNLAKSQNEFVKVRTNGSNDAIYPLEIIEGIIERIDDFHFIIKYRYGSWLIEFNNPEAWIEIESKWLEEEKHESNKNFRKRLEKRIEALEKIVFALNTQNVTTEQPEQANESLCYTCSQDCPGNDMGCNSYKKKEQPKEVIKDEAWYLKEYDKSIDLGREKFITGGYRPCGYLHYYHNEHYWRGFLKFLADQLNKEEEWCPNWYNVNHTKYSFCYDYENKNVVFCCHSILNSGEVVFSQTAIEKCKSILSEETIKKCLGIND